ncbi:uncharacterized protein CIMG_10257 [Coccidioides immitis RS]|uniref:Uncharacterized protein n=1 Tax=Coccidioides immitis (strain RS) TaxID=246410 RepID=J3K149_COCIM|nr:uncharacterized protein CIMG_10257 [Coccidioides immitis RS]EAS27652.3 hypothetical protein CIMG_10257 [Coccidioides immitis RS]
MNRCGDGDGKPTPHRRHATGVRASMMALAPVLWRPFDAEVIAACCDLSSVGMHADGLYEVRRSFPPPSHVGVMTQQQAHVRRPTSQASSDQGGLELATSTRVSPFGSVNRTQETL